MNTQPEALRLAEQLDNEWPEDCEVHAAAAELRRLHERNKEWESTTSFMQQTIDRMEAGLLRLDALNVELLDALLQIKLNAGNPKRVYSVSRAAIAKAEGEQA